MKSLLDCSLRSLEIMQKFRLRFCSPFFFCDGQNMACFESAEQSYFFLFLIGSSARWELDEEGTNWAPAWPSVWFKRVGEMELKKKFSWDFSPFIFAARGTFSAIREKVWTGKKRREISKCRERNGEISVSIWFNGWNNWHGRFSRFN